MYIWLYIYIYIHIGFGPGDLSLVFGGGPAANLFSSACDTGLLLVR